MAKLIRNESLTDDPWQVLRLASGEDPATVAVPAGDVIVPLVVWQARRDELAQRARLGVWLDSHEGPEALAGQTDHFAVIAVNFPKFTDGRGYSTAHLLRVRHGYAGELRAIGDVLRDQLFYMKRCGFDAFEIRADRDAQAALAGLRDFSQTYQSACDQALPLFRRRAAAGG